MSMSSSPLPACTLQTLDHLNRFCREEALPFELCTRLRAYFRQRRQMLASTDSGPIIAKLSSSLQVELCMHGACIWT